MAWVDDRIWCHPKLVDLSDRSFRVWVNGVAYSTGFQTKGVLSTGQQRMIGSTEKTSAELVENGLWDVVDGDESTVLIHDWDRHNGKRDARRESDRERKRAARQAQYGSQKGEQNGSGTKAEARKALAR